MDKWEYKIVGCSTQAHYNQQFNELGEEGWELVAFRMIHVHFYEAVFKRKISE